MNTSSKVRGIHRPSMALADCRQANKTVFERNRLICFSIVSSLLLLLSFEINAQTSYCSEIPEFSEFDFWIGEWNVFSGEDYQDLAGKNVIKKLSRGCLIAEHWTSARGSDGHSMRFFDPKKKVWRMYWVGPGYSVETEGTRITDGVVALKGSIHYYAQDLVTGFRVEFSKNDDGTVRQFAEQLDPETDRWELWFDGLYRRVPGLPGQ